MYEVLLKYLHYNKTIYLAVHTYITTKSRILINSLTLKNAKTIQLIIKGPNTDN